MNNLVTEIKEKPVTSSRKVAETFGKEHYNVLRDIEELECSVGFRALNFEVSSYKSKQNKKMPEYIMTKDGFTFLVMGYRGKKAARFKEAYIQRFNEMEAFINSLKQAKMEFPAFTNAIMEAHEEPKHYHFSNEINMINRIVLGLSASKFKEVNGIDKKVRSIRPYLELGQITMIEELQRIDIGLIVAGIEYEERKRILHAAYERRNLALAG